MRAAEHLTGKAVELLVNAKAEARGCGAGNKARIVIAPNVPAAHVLEIHSVIGVKR